MLNDLMTNMLFFYNKITFLTVNTIKWLIAVCPSSVLQYNILIPLKLIPAFQVFVKLQLRYGGM